MITTEPIRPENIMSLKLNYLPPEVIEAFNENIIRNYVDGSAQVFVDDVVESIIKLLPETSEIDIFRKKYLDVEGLFESVGWKVSFYKPPVAWAGETGRSYFIFEKHM